MSCQTLARLDENLRNGQSKSRHHATKGEYSPGGGKVTVSLSNVRTFDSLRNSAYRFYFLGSLGQMGAMNMQMVTRSLLIYRLTGSAVLLGLVALATAVPTLALALFGGGHCRPCAKEARHSGRSGCLSSGGFKCCRYPDYGLLEPPTPRLMVDSDS